MNNTKNAQESINFDRWEYVKSRLFPIGGKVVPKFQGPILVSLEEANEEQKGLVKESIDSINKMIKNKRVHLYEEYTGYTPQYIIDSAANTTSNNQMFYLYANSISISFAEKPSSNTDYITPRNISFPKLNTSILSDSTVIQRNNYYYSPIDEINGAILNFNFSDRTNIERKRRYILYELMRSLCYLSKENNERSFIDKSPIARLNSFQYRYARKNWVFSNTFYTPEDYEITAYDTFLLEKLYSDDFFLQFQNHLEYYYPYLYIYNFYYSGYVKLFSEVLIVILGTFLFMFSLSIFHQRKFKFSFLNYLIPILIINTSLLGLLNLKNFLQLDVFAFVSMRVFTFSLIINIFLVSILQGFTIWLIERVLMKKLKGFTLIFY
jgi:hypothetical protein